MTLKIIPTGLDFGNGFIKICIGDLVSKIPSCYSLSQPRGQLTDDLITRKPISFSLLVDNRQLYFGQDVLSEQVKREIDMLKHKPEHIRILFKAVLYQWIKEHNGLETIKDKRLRLVCGMPPELYQDRQKRLQVEKVYKGVFEQNKPDYIKYAKDIDAVPFFTSFGSLKPETLSYYVSAKVQLGYTLICDIGYETIDLCLFYHTSDKPISTVSQNNGLLYAYERSNVAEPNIAELNVLRKTNLPELYLNSIKIKIVGMLRKLQNQRQPINLVIIGGGAKLFNDEARRDFKSLVDNVTFGDEFSNVRYFERIK